jgi:thiol:disulfide interchange protein DsbA
MDRRQFSLAAGGALAGTGLTWSAAEQAQAKKPELGVHYLAIGTPAPTEAPVGKVEVLEFFWYNCPHCNAFEPELSAWLKRMPSNVAFRRVPVAFNASFVPQQRLYFSLEALGLVEKLHGKVFDAIHNQKIKLDEGQAITAWVVQNGVDQAKFLAAYNSFSVETKTKKSVQLQEAYKVEGVPALGIAGRFYTDAGLAGGMTRALQVVEMLAAEKKGTP